MAIITIFSASYCKQDEIKNKVAEKLGYSILDDSFVEEVAKKYNVSRKRLIATLNGQVSFFNNITHEREKNAAYLKSIFSSVLNKDNQIYCGNAAPLITKTIPHILKVGLVANLEYRINEAQSVENIDKKNAKNRVIKNDQSQFSWMQFLLDKDPWEEGLYDVLIPMHSTSVGDAVNLIVENANKEALNTTQKSLNLLLDFCLETRVNVPLVENGFKVNIDCKEGKVEISLKEYTIRFEHIREKIINLVSPLEGVKQVEVIMGPEAKVSTRYDELKKAPRYLLVDDEKEYVQTLSQRLQVRDLQSSIAYDGEEALEHLNQDEPDVMVLDLKMPGINGMDVLRKVKKERPHVEVIILTGHGSDKDKELALELGAFAYLEKPVEIEVLTQKMKEAYAKINKNKNTET